MSIYNSTRHKGSNNNVFYLLYSYIIFIKSELLITGEKKFQSDMSDLQKRFLNSSLSLLFLYGFGVGFHVR